MDQVDETADNQSELDCILNEEDGKRKYTCPQCATSFTRKSNLAVHFQRHRGVRAFQCSHYPDCRKSFVTTSELKAHEGTHAVERPSDDKKRPFTCTLCQMDFTLQYTLSVHMRNHTGERPYKCTECSQAFASRYNLEGHLRTHTGEKPFKCSQCPRTFSRRYHLLVHMRAHARGWQYKCSQCPSGQCRHQGDCPVTNEVIEDDVFDGEPSDGEVYSEVKEEPYFIQEDLSSALDQQDAPQKQGPIGKEQLEDYYDNDNLLFQCPDCPKTFEQKPAFKRHLRTHNEERPFKCTRCPKSFKQVRHLRVHEESHTRAVQCSQCSLVCASDNVLRLHLLTHTRENNPTCPHCSMNFTRRSTLNKHLKQYCRSLQKPESECCTQCSQPISSESNHGECCQPESSHAGRNEEPTNLTEEGVCQISEDKTNQSNTNAESQEKNEIVENLQDSSNGNDEMLCQIKKEANLLLHQDKVCKNPEKLNDLEGNHEFNEQVKYEMYEELIEEFKEEPTNDLLLKDNFDGNIESNPKDNNENPLFKCPKCPKTFRPFS